MLYHPNPIPSSKLWDHLISLQKQAKPTFKRKKKDDSDLLQKFERMSIQSQSLTDHLKKLKLESATTSDDPTLVHVLPVSATTGNESAPIMVPNSPTDVSDGCTTTLEASTSLQRGSKSLLPPNL